MGSVFARSGERQQFWVGEGVADSIYEVVMLLWYIIHRELSPVLCLQPLQEELQPQIVLLSNNALDLDNKCPWESKTIFHSFDCAALSSWAFLAVVAHRFRRFCCHFTV